ncbi:hypothetical protein TIFTF001_044989, partial [Ficus carica]
GLFDEDVAVKEKEKKQVECFVEKVCDAVSTNDDDESDLGAKKFRSKDNAADCVEDSTPCNQKIVVYDKDFASSLLVKSQKQESTILI